MNNVQFGEVPQFESNSIPRVIYKKPPALAGLVLKMGLTKTPEQANWVLVCMAVIFFVAAIVIFLSAV